VTALRRSVLVIDGVPAEWPPPRADAVPDAVLITPAALRNELLREIVEDCRRFDSGIIFDAAHDSLKEWVGLPVDSLAARLSSAGESEALERQLDELARHGVDLGVELVVDSARRVLALRTAARACRRLRSVLCDPEQLAASLGVEFTLEVDALAFPRGELVLAAAEHRVPAVGCFPAAGHHRRAAGDVTPERFSFSMGLHGGICRDWAAVERCNRGFAPGEEAQGRARRVLDAMEEAAREGRGAISLDGRMIDIPFVHLSERTLQRAERVRDRGRFLEGLGRFDG
jgi:citrate lyase beta subunit